MRETKAFASLTSSLLARKGQARPAMRPQGGFGITMSGPDDLGWNDMGHDAGQEAGQSADPATEAAMPETPPVLRQQEQLAAAMAAPAPAPAPAEGDRAAPQAATAPQPREAGRKAAFTLRLEAERHLRLRLACAAQNRSAQQIVTAALDSFLAKSPEVERLAASLSAHGAGRE